MNLICFDNKIEFILLQKDIQEYSDDILLSQKKNPYYNVCLHKSFMLDVPINFDHIISVFFNQIYSKKYKYNTKQIQGIFKHFLEYCFRTINNTLPITLKRNYDYKKAVLPIKTENNFIDIIYVSYNTTMDLSTTFNNIYFDEKLILTIFNETLMKYFINLLL